MTYNLISSTGSILLPPKARMEYKGLELFGRSSMDWNLPLQQNAVMLADALDAKLDKTINCDIIPDAPDTYTLGSLENPFKDIYVGANSFYVNGQKVISDDSGTITLGADTDQNIRIQPTGLGDIEFYPSGGGNIEMKGTVEFAAGKALRTSDGSDMYFDQGIVVDGNVQADTFNGHVIAQDIPANASFTDTVYTKPTSEPITYIAGLQAALDEKVDDSQVLTNVPANAKFTDTVYTKPTSEPISYINGLQTALTGKVDNAKVLTNVPANAKFTDTQLTDAQIAAMGYKKTDTDTTYSNLSELTNDMGFIQNETKTTLSMVGNVLLYSDETGAVTTHDLSLYLDDSNLARVVSGTYSAATKSLIFTRDDSSTFSIDASMFFDDTNMVTSVNGHTGAVTIAMPDISGLEDELDTKVTKVTGKDLSSNDYTNADQVKLQGIEAGATADQTKADIDLLGVDAATVNGKTVMVDVPANAVFTDTKLSDTDIASMGYIKTFTDTTYSNVSEFTNDAGYLMSETATTLTKVGNELRYTNEAGEVQSIDLSVYIDDTNLSQLVSGTLNGNTGMATFTRDDNSSFTVDMSSLLDNVTLTKADIDAMGVDAGTVNGKTVETNVPSGAKFTDTWRPVQNNLTSDSGFADNSLSAYQGKVLKDMIDGLNGSKVDSDGYVATDNNYSTYEKVKLSQIESGATQDQTKADIDALGINASTVNGKTVGSNVPANAVFTDTVYDDSDVAKYEDADPSYGSTNANGMLHIGGRDLILGGAGGLGWRSSVLSGSTVVGTDGHTNTIIDNNGRIDAAWIKNIPGSWTEETTTSFAKVGNELQYTDEEGNTTSVDLTTYLDDSNLARLVNGSIDSTGLATFTRDDSTTFTVDFSSLFDDTKLTSSEISGMGFRTNTEHASWEANFETAQAAKEAEHGVFADFVSSFDAAK